MNQSDEQNSIDNLSFLSEIYRKGAKQEETYLMQCVEEAQQRYYQRALKTDIDQILEQLPLDLVMILRNDFLEPIEKDWWRKRYAPPIYYRLKNIAIDAFFHCLYT